MDSLPARSLGLNQRITEGYPQPKRSDVAYVALAQYLDRPLAFSVIKLFFSHRMYLGAMLTRRFHKVTNVCTITIRMRHLATLSNIAYIRTLLCIMPRFKYPSSINIYVLF